jgi:hypothetical protein
MGRRVAQCVAAVGFLFILTGIFCLVVCAYEKHATGNWLSDEVFLWEQRGILSAGIGAIIAYSALMAWNIMDRGR